MLYLLLAAVGLALLVLNLRRSPPFLVLGAAAVSLPVTSVADMIAHDILRLYIYHPRLHPVPAADEQIGLVLADLVFVPSLLSTLATVPAQRRLPLGLLLVGVVVAIEWVFVRVGSLEHHGWRFWYSAVGFTLLASGVIGWITLLERRGYQGFLRVGILLGLTTQMVESGGNFTAAILGRLSARSGIFGASLPDLSLGTYLLYQTPAVLLITAALTRGWARSGWGYLGTGAALWGWLALLDGRGLLRHAARWHPLEEVIILLLIQALLSRVDRYLESRERSPVG